MVSTGAGLGFLKDTVACRRIEMSQTSRAFPSKVFSPIACECTIINILFECIFIFITIQISWQSNALSLCLCFYILRIIEFISFFLKAAFEFLM